MLFGFLGNKLLMSSLESCHAAMFHLLFLDVTASTSLDSLRIWQKFLKYQTKSIIGELIQTGTFSAGLY